MKKQYMMPTIKLGEMDEMDDLLTTSLGKYDEVVDDPNDILSRENYLWDEEDF